MKAMEQLHEALKEMMEGIASGEGDIAARIGRIDELSARLPAAAPPMLRHYLERRSYAKALDFLEGRDESPPGRC